MIPIFFTVFFRLFLSDKKYLVQKNISKKGNIAGGLFMKRWNRQGKKRREKEVERQTHREKIL